MRYVRWLLAAAAVVLVVVLWSRVERDAPRVERAQAPPAQPTNRTHAEEQDSLCLFGDDFLDRAGWRWRPDVEREPLLAVSLLPIAGRVVDGEGVGIGHVRVTLKAEDAPARWYEYDPALGGRGGPTQEDGSYRFPHVPEGVYSVVAVIETWGRDLAYTRRSVAAGSIDVQIEIPQRPIRLPITIRVKALLPDGSPLPKGSMGIWGFPGGIRGAIEAGYGEMQFTGSRPPPGQTHVHLVVSPEGDHPDVAPTDTLIDLRQGTYEIRLDQGRTLTGMVLLDGKPCAVKIWADGRGWTPGRYTSQSSSYGRFRFENLPKGKVSLHLGRCASPYRLNEAIVVRTDAKEVVVPLTRSVSVTGRVVPPAGCPLGEVKLRLWWPLRPGRYVSSVNGSYRDIGDKFDVGSLTPGSRCELWVWGTFADGTRFVPRAVPFVAGSELLQIHVHAGREVRGRVVRPDGSPVPLAAVRTQHPESMTWKQHEPEFTPRTRTDANGAFRLTGIDAGGQYLIVCDAADLTQVGPPSFVRGGEDLRVVMARPRRIQGRVVDEEGRSLYGLTIDHWHAGPNAPLFSWSWGPPLGGDGKFTLEGLAPGRHVLYVWSNDWRSKDDRYALTTVEAGASDVRLVLRSGKTVQGRATLADGSPTWCQVRVEGPWGIRGTSTRENGHFAFRGIPPGPCSITGRYNHQITAKLLSDTVRVEAGGSPVTLVLRKP